MIPLKTRIPVRENSEVVIICPEELSPSSKSEVLEEETSLAIHGKVGGEKLALLGDFFWPMIFYDWLFEDVSGGHIMGIFHGIYYQME